MTSFKQKQGKKKESQTSWEVGDISIDRNLNGSYTLSKLVGNYLFSRTYYQYPKSEALKLFRKAVKEEKEAQNFGLSKSASKWLDRQKGL